MREEAAKLEVSILEAEEELEIAKEKLQATEIKLSSHHCSAS